MREFFRGWKRKVGVVTLAMLLAVGVLSFRSFYSGDEIQLGTVFQRVHVLTSISGEAQWSTWSEYPLNWEPRWRTWKYQGKISDHQTIDGERELWRSPIEGDQTSSEPQGINESKWFARVSQPVLSVVTFSMGSTRRSERRYLGNGVVIPYYSIVIPLTLLSAWLLLSKPRPVSKHAATTPPVAEV